jgi:hypothetical protein
MARVLKFSLSSLTLYLPDGQVVEEVNFEASPVYPGLQ